MNTAIVLDIPPSTHSPDNYIEFQRIVDLILILENDLAYTNFDFDVFDFVFLKNKGQVHKGLRVHSNTRRILRTKCGRSITNVY